MSDSLEEKQLQFQIPLSFPFIKGNFPTYANAVLVNIIPDGVIIDMGFFDPLSVKEIHDKFKEEANVNPTEISPVDVQSVGRFVIGRELAEQLITQIQAALDNAK